MLTAKQHKRRLLARGASLIYLLLLLVAFDGQETLPAEREQGRELTLDAGLRIGDLSQAVLPLRNGLIDEPAPSQVPLAHTDLCAPSVTDVFFAQYLEQNPGVPTTAGVKRYLLFSCLRLGEAPPLV